MATAEKKSFEQPDETTKPAEKITVDVVTAGGLKFQRVTASPGWQWSKHMKPVAKTEQCEKHHVAYVISGKLHARMKDGKEMDISPGEVGVIPPGHDGWTVGDTPAVWIEIPH